MSCGRASNGCRACATRCGCLHLGSLELKDQWRKLEPQLGDVEKKAEELTEASRPPSSTPSSDSKRFARRSRKTTEPKASEARSLRAKCFCELIVLASG